jgi:hypothetical protein
MNKPSFLLAWSAAAGAMDTATGLLLIVSPAWVLQRIGISVPTESLVFMGWIGTFVLSVGLSYGFALVRPRYGEPVWWLTSLVRISVALYVLLHVWNGSLATRWLLVAGTDAAVALVQCILLRAGWWKEAAS